MPSFLTGPGLGRVVEAFDNIRRKKLDEGASAGLGGRRWTERPDRLLSVCFFVLDVAGVGSRRDSLIVGLSRDLMKPDERFLGVGWKERRNSLCVDGFMKGWVRELERIVQWRRELYFVCRGLVFA